jgi:hypothetical protein
VHAANRTRFRPRHKPVPILGQRGFPEKTDYASRNSQAQCAHNSPPDIRRMPPPTTAKMAGIGDFLKRVADSIAPRCVFENATSAI